MFKKTFLLLNYQKLSTFFGQKSKKTIVMFFLVLSYGITHNQLKMLDLLSPSKHLMQDALNILLWSILVNHNRPELKENFKFTIIFLWKAKTKTERLWKYHFQKFDKVKVVYFNIFFQIFKIFTNLTFFSLNLYSS